MKRLLLSYIMTIACSGFAQFQNSYVNQEYKVLGVESGWPVYQYRDTNYFQLNAHRVNIPNVAKGYMKLDDTGRVVTLDSIPYLNISGRPSVTDISSKQNYADSNTWDASKSWVSQTLLPYATAQWVVDRFADRSLTINGITQDLSANRTWTIDKTGIGLSNVDNTSDANKPISTATQTALNGKLSSESDPIWISDKPSYATNASLATKFTIPSGTTAQYVRGDGSLATLPTNAGTVTSVSGTLPISVVTGTTTPVVSIANAAADGATKGAAAFNASYFAATSGIVTNTWTRGTGTISSNAVTINAPRGLITYNSPSILAAGQVSVTLTNSFITSTSTVSLTINGLGSDLTGSAAVYLKSVSNGSCVINIRNLNLLSLFNSSFGIDYTVQN